MILLLISVLMFPTIDSSKSIRWNPEQHNFEEWPKSQVFIFHTKNPLDFDYPDCFGTLLTPSLVLTIASCFKECVYCKGFLWDLLNENTVSILWFYIVNIISRITNIAFSWVFQPIRPFWQTKTQNIIENSRLGFQETKVLRVCYLVCFIF